MSDGTGAVASLYESIAALVRDARQVATRGRDHFERVEDTPIRVTVSGVRGKSTVVRWLNEVLADRGLETYAKVTGNHAVSYRNREEHPIERSGPTRLYENERELRRFAPVDAVVAENQGIREYTTRLANELYDPDVVILLNVRRDHQSTLGATLSDIARVFARSIPEDAHVVSGDRNEAVNDYLRQELTATGHEFTVAAPPAGSPFADVFGARSAFVVDETLRTLGLEPLPAGRIEEFVEQLRAEWGWRRLEDGGLVANGAMMNDIESTELLRQFLVDRLDDRTLTPFVYTRRDRAGRTAAFVHYLNWLAKNDLVGRIHVAGTHAGVVERRVDATVVDHSGTDGAEAVLGDCLADGFPVYLMGNTVATFMREMADAIDRRAVE